MVLDSVLDAIGGTPLVRLGRLWPGPGAILAKLDYLNPGGSKKDRIGLRMIEEAESSGALAPGQTVVELTSGNTGTGLAIGCAVKGYPFIAVMSRGNSEERAQMTAFGAEEVLVDQRPGPAGSSARKTARRVESGPATSRGRGDGVTKTSDEAHQCPGGAGRTARPRPCNRPRPS